MEGNRISNNTVGIYLQNGADAQVRFNSVENNQFGIYCFSCVDGNVQRNTVRNSNYAGIDIAHIGATGVTVLQNIVESNGVSFGSPGIQSGFDSSYVTIHSNVTERNGDHGILAFNIDGSSIRGNISSRNGSDGLDLYQFSFTSAAAPVIKHNMSVANIGHGFDLRNSANFEANTAIQNSTGVKTTSSFVSFNENSTYGNTTYGLDNIGPNNLTLQDHFLGGNGINGSWTGNYVAKPNLTKVGIAKGLGQ